MTIAQFYRISGLGMLIGASAFIVHLVLRSMATAGLDPVTFAQQNSWVPINVLGVVGAALVIVCLPVLYAKLAGPTGRLGLIGVLLIALAWLFFGLFLSLYSVLVAPWLADQAPELAAAPLPAGARPAPLGRLCTARCGDPDRGWGLHRTQRPCRQPGDQPAL